ncbi:Uncharacterised protein [Mycobacterium tuberculosis]|uniref:Uncharacterized protein n=1 Tax=Mycobacterium tuberculosis TaxID=1773 RepID=A0A0U0T642_MYCTX|nr:Uncharacterised protein [Mycobacterium tuberculosis]CNV24508.1 Uncharacterised protein [Mycobacterium tuberculosis]CNV57391.1 Uncharacterised protein [Mycobacterium tuberculosis]CNX44924.1 Uncharacterised protein [Mycobacterium tuberculosis]COV84470.1 Uncharacterised protein [Mycobacterium tuberculosis]
MHHVGARVALRGTPAPPGIHRRDYGVTLDEFPGFHVDSVHPKRFGDLLHVGNRGPGSFAGTGSADGALIGDLPTRFGVERGAI